MVTFLEIVSGKNEGSRYRLEDGLQLGRSKGHILIDDPKVSGLHAQIETDAKGQLILVDLDSSNGLLITGRKVKRIALLPGVSFEIGRTQCRIITVEENQARSYARIMTWRTILGESLDGVKISNQTTLRRVLPFSPPLVLNFVQGVQTNDVITIGYGPRTVGGDNLDLELLDPEAPDTAFEIVPTVSGAEIKNLAPTIVKLNNHAFDKESLTEGDIISVGHTQIRVSYA